MINFNLLKNESIYQILDLIPAIIYWKHVDGYALGCNKSELDLFGLNSRDQFIGKNEADFLPPHEVEQILSINQIVLEEGYYSGEEAFTINGELRVFLSNKTRICDEHGNIVGIFGTSVEITHTKQKMEQEKMAAIQEEEIKISQILDLIPAHIYWKYKNEYYLGCNKAQRDFMGMDLTGKNEYDCVPKEEADKVHHADQYVLDNGSWSGEELISDYHGVTRTYFSSKNCLLNSKNEVTGLVGISIDITDTKEKERLQGENLKHQALLEQQEKFNNDVGQMVHDLKSSLTSLNSLLNEESLHLPEVKRNILKSSVTSITDITHQMLRRYHKDPESLDEPKQPVLISDLVLQIASEKRYEYKDLALKIEAKINDYVKGCEIAFIEVELNNFRRMLYNLINNSVDALENKPDGKIELELYANEQQVSVLIQDNGKGMTEEMINRINEDIQFSGGKADGHGLGLQQVKNTLNRNKGTMQIVSNPGVGSTFVLKFPRIAKPNWVADEIKFNKDDLIIILDDDESIHHAWDDRFASILTDTPTIELRHFKDGMETINFINSLSDEKKANVYLLTDYELLGQNLNGIEVILQTGLKRTLLVTSNYTTAKVRNRALNAKVKLLPKYLAFYVKISVEKKLEPASKIVDILWLDDDEGGVRSIIENYYKNLEIDIYTDPIKFLEEIDQYPETTRIILDHYYYTFDIDCELDGVKIAGILYEKGYTKLLLITGEEPNRTIPPYLKVILKNDLKQLQGLEW